jgi:hypothetical protein
MRQAINNLQSTVAGFGFVSGDNVFKVVDTPHPIAVQTMIKACYEGRIDLALEKLEELWDKGYSAVDVISTMFRVTKTVDTLSEHSKLEFIKVCFLLACTFPFRQALIFSRKSGSRTCVSWRASPLCCSLRDASQGFARST